MNYLIGDTIRFLAIIKNFEGVEEAPAVIKVSVYKQDRTEILPPTTPDLIIGTTAQYKYDWQIPTGTAKNSTLIVVWNWSGPQKKEMNFIVANL